MTVEQDYRLAKKAARELPRTQSAYRNLTQTASSLQREDFSTFTHFNPFIPRKDGTRRAFYEVRQRAAGTIQRIKEVSMPHVQEREKLLRELIEAGREASAREILTVEREEKGVTKKQIADRLGIARTGVVHVEQGVRPVNLTYIQAYAEELGLDSELVDQLKRKIEEEKEQRRVNTIKKRNIPLPENATFGDTLRHIRTALGLSLKDIAAETGLTISALAQIERNGTEMKEDTVWVKLLEIKSFQFPSEVLPLWYTAPQNQSEYLRMLRVRKGLTRAEFAEKAGRNPQSIHHSEQSAFRPNFSTIKVYEAVLGEKIVFPEFPRTKLRPNQAESGKI